MGEGGWAERGYDRRGGYGEVPGKRDKMNSDQRAMTLQGHLTKRGTN